MNTLTLIGRDTKLFVEDLSIHDYMLENIVAKSRFLVIGGAGSIGQPVTKEIIKI